MHLPIFFRFGPVGLIIKAWWIVLLSLCFHLPILLALTIPGGMGALLASVPTTLESILQLFSMHHSLDATRWTYRSDRI